MTCAQILTGIPKGGSSHAEQSLYSGNIHRAFEQATLKDNIHLNCHVLD